VKTLLKHQTKREELIKFLLLLSVFIGYFGYLSWEYDLATGGIVAALTWSFFVLCTPIADAGFLLDFPIRIITGIRMLFTEMGVWALAFIINIATLKFNPAAYETTFLTSLFHKILTTPWPYWIIIALCGLGTFLSIRFGDEMMDVMAHNERSLHHKHGFKHRLISMIALMALIMFSYYHILATLDVHLPLH
tara:strand:- start:34061 stop:34636 length:576 start_codon:yes stop_codon:yes gene_type:complete